MNRILNLKHLVISGAILFASGSALAADVGVSVSIGQPGFYGRIDIGDYPYPQPRVIYNRPVVIHRHVDMYEPIYLRVPPGHAKKWSRYCGRYNACNRPVYFVQDNWYHNEYAPLYRERHDEGYRGRDDDRNHGRNNDRGNDHSRGHGQGRH